MRGRGCIVDSSGETAMPPGYDAFRGDKPLDFQTVPTRGSDSGARVCMQNASKKGGPDNSTGLPLLVFQRHEQII